METREAREMVKVKFLKVINANDKARGVDVFVTALLLFSLLLFQPLSFFYSYPIYLYLSYILFHIP